MRPRRLVVVTGTATEVGKTWVGARLLVQARASGLSVAARKPVQSFGPGDAATDAERLAAASGESPDDVCPPARSYPLPMAPPMAAHQLGRPVPVLLDLVDALGRSWGREAVDVGVVEGAGGVASPIAADGDNAALARAVSADCVVLVADAGLGAINSARLGATALAGLPVVVHLNRFEPQDPLHALNRDWLRDRDRMTLSADTSALFDLVIAATGPGRCG